MGVGWSYIYNMGLRTTFIPLYELPFIPASSFIILYIIILCIRSVYSENKQSYDVTDPEPYGKLCSHALTLYMYVCMIWLFSTIFV